MIAGARRLRGCTAAQAGGSAALAAVWGSERVSDGMRRRAWVAGVTRDAELEAGVRCEDWVWILLGFRTGRGGRRC